MQAMLQPPKQTNIPNWKIKLNPLISIFLNIIIKKKKDTKYKIGHYYINKS